MKHLFVSKQISTILKDMGFKENCIAIYSTNGIMSSGEEKGFKPEHVYYKEHGAILYQQAIDFLREVRGFSIEVNSYTEIFGGPIFYSFDIRQDGEQWVSQLKVFNTHMEAIDFAIDHLLYSYEWKN